MDVAKDRQMNKMEMKIAFVEKEIMLDSEMGLPFIKQGCTDVIAACILEKKNKGGKFYTPLFTSVELR